YPVGPKRSGMSGNGRNQPGSEHAGKASRPRAPDLDAEHKALATLSERHGVPAIDIRKVNFPVSNLELIPVEIARRHSVLPVLMREDAIFLAMADPSERRVIEELEFVSGKRVFPYVAHTEQLAAVIDQAYQARDRGEPRYVGPHAIDSRPTTTPRSSSKSKA